MWTEIIKNLNSAGLSDVEIARRVGVNQSTITRLRHGLVKNTSYQTGQALIDLRDEIAQERQAA